MVQVHVFRLQLSVAAILLHFRPFPLFSHRGQRPTGVSFLRRVSIQVWNVHRRRHCCKSGQSANSDLWDTHPQRTDSTKRLSKIGGHNEQPMHAIESEGHRVQGRSLKTHRRVRRRTSTIVVAPPDQTTVPQTSPCHLRDLHYTPGQQSCKAVNISIMDARRNPTSRQPKMLGQQPSHKLAECAQCKNPIILLIDKGSTKLELYASTDSRSTRG